MRRASSSVPVAVTGAVAIVAALAVGLAALLGAFSSLPAHAAARRAPQAVLRLPAVPIMQLKGHVCTGQGWSPEVVAGGSGAATVDPRPTGATVFWLPGLNSTQCRAVTTKINAAQSVSLAKAVRAAPIPRDGAINCPMDDASAAWVFFRYAARPSLDVVKVELTGCRFVSAPHRSAVGWNSNVAGLLQRWEPRGWSQG